MPKAFWPRRAVRLDQKPFPWALLACLKLFIRSSIFMMRLAIFSIAWTLISAQQVIQDPVEDFCRRHQHQTCIIDSKLYIDGGLEYFGTGISGSSRPERNTWLLYGDLNNISPGTPPLYSNLSKGSEVPTTSGGVLWPDQANKLFYLFGGEYNNASVQTSNSLWFYDTIYNSWNRTSPDGSQARISWPAFGASAVTDEGVAYYYGGYLNNKTVSGWNEPPLMLNSLVSYSMNDGKWGNSTDGAARAEGALQYIPAGDRGMLVYFGGVETSSRGLVSYTNMTQIQLYDISTMRWYTQTASGDVPKARRGFCSNVVWAKDQSSYNIYIYGGIISDGTAVGDIYVLSVPSFRWIQYPASQEKVWRGGKAWASCSLFQSSQMIIMGGFYTNSSRDHCDSAETKGQHPVILGQDSVELGLTNKYGRLMANITEYRVPDDITSVIGGDVDGKATVTAPAGSWATTDLAVYFTRRYSAYSRTATRPVPTSGALTPPTSTSPPSSGSGTNIGAIAGGVVGGAVGLISAIVAIIFYMRSRRRKQATQVKGPSGSNVTPHPESSEMDGKSVKHISMSPGSTMYSPNTQVSAYSPQGSPQPQSDLYNSAYYSDSPGQHQYSSEWGHPGGLGLLPQHGQQQTYAQKAQPSVELPTTQTPARPAELPE